MAGLTLGTSVRVEFMAEEDKSRDLVDPDPRDGLLGGMKLGEFLDVGRFFLDRDVARHALLSLRDSGLLAGGGHRVAFGALQQGHFGVGLMRKGKRLVSRQHE